MFCFKVGVRQNFGLCLTKSFYAYYYQLLKMLGVIQQPKEKK